MAQAHLVSFARGDLTRALESLRLRQLEVDAHALEGLYIAADQADEADRALQAAGWPPMPVIGVSYGALSGVQALLSAARAIAVGDAALLLVVGDGSAALLAVGAALQSYNVRSVAAVGPSASGPDGEIAAMKLAVRAGDLSEQAEQAEDLAAVLHAAADMASTGQTQRTLWFGQGLALKLIRA